MTSEPRSLAQDVQTRVLEGMGLVVLHSAHHSKPFRLLMGTSGALRGREHEGRELVWTVDSGHEIAAGIPAVIPLERHEMYGEFFDIPAPDELVFISCSRAAKFSGAAAASGAARARSSISAPATRRIRSTTTTPPSNA